MVFYFFTIFYAAVIAALSQSNFSSEKFCAFNIDEPICSSQEKFHTTGLFHDNLTSLLVSSPCKIELRNNAVFLNESLTPWNGWKNEILTDTGKNEPKCAVYFRPGAES